MYFITNIAVPEMIPYSLIDIINYLNLLECGVLVGRILIPGSEDDNLVLVYYKQLAVLLIHQRLVGLICSIN